MTRMTGIKTVLLLAATLLACNEDEPCPAGLTFEKGYCAKQQSPVDAGATPDAEADTGEGDSSATNDAEIDSTTDSIGTTADFGTACTLPTECGGVASYCALQPGVPVGYCTAPGCDTMPQICPAGWTCFNVGIFKPGEPYVCLRP